MLQMMHQVSVQPVGRIKHACNYRPFCITVLCVLITINDASFWQLQLDRAAVLGMGVTGALAGGGVINYYILSSCDWL